jgi:hypothetical protein
VQTTWDDMEAPRSRRKAVQFDECDWAAALTSDPLVRVGTGSGIKLEQTIQREIIKGLRALGIRVKHTPNAVPFGGDAGAKIKQASRWRADGIIAGWPDLDLIWSVGARGTRIVHYGHIEVKRRGGYLDPDQVRCIAHMKADGCLVGAAWSLDSALDVIAGWGWIGVAKSKT